jgi:hypothetical protein
LSKVTFGSEFAFRDLRAIIAVENIVLFSDVYELQGGRSDHIRKPPATGSIRPECCHEY